MKHTKRAIAALLAAVMLVGLLPAAAAAEKKETPTPERSSVMLGADSLLNGDTLVLGYVKEDASAPDYPLEWQVLDTNADTQGREGGKLLVSKFLLPALSTSENGGLDMSTLSGFHLPEEYAVLPTTLADRAYVADLNENIISDYKNSGIDYAGVYTQGEANALTAASYFALSAEELEQYFPNTDTSLSVAGENDLLRRPYAAAYAIADAGSRSWALRSVSKTGSETAVVPASSSDKHLAQAGGLVASTDTELLSRPAFNLRSNAITFIYQTSLAHTTVPQAGTVSTEETVPDTGKEDCMLETQSVTGTSEWRAALHALPTLQLMVSYRQDGSVVLTPPAGHTYSIGVLQVREDGSVASWGTAKSQDFGVFTFMPDEGVSDLYFYSYVKDAVSNQLYTSNLVHVGAGTAAAMTLGTGHLRNGDTVHFGQVAEGYVANADMAVTGMAGMDGNVTKNGVYNNEYVVWDDQAVFLVTLAPNKSGTYKISSEDVYEMVEKHNISSFGLTPEQRDKSAQRIQAITTAAMNKANADNAGLANVDLQSLDNVFATSQTYNAFAYNWINDTQMEIAQYIPRRMMPISATVEAKNKAVNGTKFFLLSANEYLALPQSVRDLLGTIVLRSKVTEYVSILANTGPITATNDLVVTYGNQKIETQNSLREDVSDVGAAVGFNLLRENVVYMFQQGAVSQDVVTGELPEVPAYDPDNTDWEIAVLEPNIHLEADAATIGDGAKPQLLISGARYPYGASSESYLSMLITDGAGNVKRYGRVLDLKTKSASEHYYPIDIDYDLLAYGDRVYIINETINTAVSMDRPAVSASAPLLVWEQKLDGQVNFNCSDYLPGETIVADLSEITVSGGDVAYKWMDERWGTVSTGTAWTADDEVQAVCVTASLNSDFLQTTGATIPAAKGELLAYRGTHEQDDFAGGTLYYGENGSENYTWTITGRPTAGVQAVRDKSGYAPLAKDLSTDNVLSIMRNDLTTLGSLQLSGYLRYGVLGSDLADAAANINGVRFNASSETDVQVFRPSAADYQKFAEQGMTAALFASVSGFDTEDDWYLRNTGTLQRCGAVDNIQQLQLKKRTDDSLTREAVNVNNKDIVFYTPADKALTYSVLSGLRAQSVNEWKLTVIDPHCVEYRSFVAKRSGHTITADCSFYENVANRYVTAWAEKDGEIVWLDSASAAASGDYSVNFAIPEEIEIDAAYAVLRKDNGAYHSDACTAPQSAEPTEVLVEIYCNGERTDENCTVYLCGSSGGQRTTYYCGETVYSIITAEHNYEIHDVTVTFDDGTVEHIQNTAHFPAESADMTFTARGENPVLRIYLQTQAHNIYTMTETYDENYDLISEPENKIIAPVTAHGGSTYTYTVACKEGYFIDSITVNDKTAPMTKTVEVLLVYDETVFPLTTYAPGEYEASMPIDSDSVIAVEYRKIPEFALTLAAIPPEGGTIASDCGESIKAGDTVTVYAQANEGWALTHVTLSSETEPEENLERGENGYTFEMPPHAATVTAWFEKYCPITVEVYVDGELKNTGCTWKLTDDEGKERTTFYQGQNVSFTATADDGYIVEYACLGNTSLKYDDASVNDLFVFREDRSCIQVYLSTQKTNITIECQTLDAEGKVMDVAGGEVDAPEQARYQQLYIYAANAFDGYCVESITANGVPVENPDPKDITIGGETITTYPSGDYEAYGTKEDKAYFVTFRALPELSITSHFEDVSNGTTEAVDASVIYSVGGIEKQTFRPGDEITATVTCASNYAVDSVNAAAEFTQTDKYTFTFTMPDSDLDVTYHLKKLAIKAAFLHVDEDINLIYSVQVPEGFENPTATFTFMDRNYTTNDYEIGADGRYNFEFENVTPQCMGEPVDVTVSASCGKYTYSHTNTGYSVRRYCVNMLGKTNDSLLRTLLSDILVYGEKAQLYTGFKTDALVTENVDLSAASTYPGLSGLHEDFIGTADEDVRWRAATLCLSNNVSLELKFHASDTAGLAVTLRIGEKAQTFTEFTPVEGEENTYSVIFHGILATEFDVPVYASFSRNGEKIGNTLKYSVNIYICNKQNCGNAPLENLLKALYNYGESAQKYYCERVLRK